MSGINKSLDKILKNEEYIFENNDDTSVSPPSNIYSYTETRSCYDLVRMISDKDLKRDPEFQRNDVWDIQQKTRFIDSLLKKLPIPSMCFSVDSNDNYLTIDGRQRIGTILEFFSQENLENRLSTLEDIDERISGKSILEIRTNNPDVFRTIGNFSIPINVIKCDYKRKDNLTYIYNIFHRLNTGGLKLNNQEIRNCIYRGNFLELINQCNKNEKWSLWANSLAKNKRMRGAERILLFFCMYNQLEKYENKLSSFMNDFLADHQHSEKEWITKQKNIFIQTINIASQIDLNTTRNIYIDAVLYGIAKNIESCKTKSKEQLQNLYEKLLISPAFEFKKLQEGTSNKRKLLERYDAARVIFGE